MVVYDLNPQFAEKYRHHRRAYLAVQKAREQAERELEEYKKMPADEFIKKIR